MRQVLRGLAIVLLGLPAVPAGAQQGSIQLSASAHGVTGDPAARADESALEPDFGVSWLEPASRFGAFQLQLHGTSRTGEPHVGRAYVSVRDLKYRGATWTFEAGDTHLTPAIGDYRFSNLFTPAITFTGAAASVRRTDSTVTVVAGRTTALRNIFGTDPDALGQTLAIAHAMHRFSPHLDVQARASDVRTSGLKEFSYSIASSRQVGGGARLMITPAIHLVGDGSLVSYRREGTADTMRDGSFLAGTSWLLARGWLQINAFRFSPGEFPALNYQLQDREGVFAAGEYDVLQRLRVFGGVDSFRSNLKPADAAAASGPSTGTNGMRRFGGVRFQLWPRSAVTVRFEDGDRIARPIRAGFGAPSDSDTGSWSAEWQAIFGSATTFARYSRRENVDHSNSTASSSQHDASGQLFWTVSRGLQVFGIAVVTENEMLLGGGNTYWQAGGGAQVQVPRRNLWLRAEGTMSRNIDLLTDRFVPRESLSLGVNGQVARQTTIGFNVHVDRAPLPSFAGNPWGTRSMLRVTHTISTGAARVASAAPGAAPAALRRGTGSILGSVFADWNANGVQDADENPLEGIPVRIAELSAATTGGNGQFSFVNVPVGVLAVGVDTTALPLDFDAPAQPSMEVELTRGATRRVAFGLIPLGSIAGRVVRDANANGVADPGEETIDGAIVILDGGVRSEQTRRGRFRFDAVRSGEHTVQLLLESIGDGAKTTSPATLAAPLTRNAVAADLTFLVSIEKRPEIRRVFPSRSGAVPPSTVAPRAGSTAVNGAGAAPSSNRASAAVAGGRGARALATAPPTRRTRPGYAVQIAALSDRSRAETLANELKTAGYPAYVEPSAGGAGPFRVRVGGYETVAAAETVRAALEKARGGKFWIASERR